jgi:mono/diheme cytochrome c family protein
VKYLIVSWLALAGCFAKLEPDVGPLAHAPCSNADSDPAHEVSYADDLLPLFKEYHCASCHTPGGKTPIGIVVGGLDLTSYNSLRAGGARSMAGIVVAGDACSSVLLQKLEAGPPFGARMPLDGPEYLEDEDLELFADWIIEGARDN